MKFFANFVLLAAAVVAGHCLPVHNGLPTPQQVKELTVATLLYLQSTLPKVHQMPLPDYVNQHMVLSDINTDLVASRRNGVAYGVNELLFDQYEFNATTSSTKYRLTAPNLTEVYDYEAEGEIFGLKASGKGVLRIETTGFGYSVSDLRFEEIDNSLQISALELSFVLDNVAISLTGLNVEKVSVQQIETLLDWYVLVKARQSREELSKGFASAMKKNLNQLLSGHSTDQVIQWLKEHTNQEVHKDFTQNFVTNFVKVI